jgi:hypothetical protein
VTRAEDVLGGYELLVVSGDALETFELSREGTVTLGRAEDNAIRIDHPSVSRQHARLTLGTRILIEDLGGANGTFVRDTAEGRAHGQHVAPHTGQSAGSTRSAPAEEGARHR